MTAAEGRRLESAPRDLLLAQLAAADRPQHTTQPWHVVRQCSGGPELPVCGHRWEWTAELHARWLTYREPDFGVYYNARRAER